jgi:hypothetical protein
MGLIQDFISQRPSSPVFHYASAAAAISIIRNKEIWASKISHLNDSAEHSHAAEWIADEVARRDRKPGALNRLLGNVALYGAKPAISPIYSSALSEVQPLGDSANPGRSLLSFARTKKIVYVASFSEEQDSLSQWRAYCSSGNGYSLGFDTSKFKGNSATGISLIKCVYEDDEKRELVAALVEDCEARDDGSDGRDWSIFMDILVVMASMKHVSFKDEHEWRLVSFGGDIMPLYRPGRHGIVPYVEIPFGQEGQLFLSDVCIGNEVAWICCA